MTDDYFIYDDEPDPLSMNEEDYFKAREEYIRKAKEQSERMRKDIEKEKQRYNSK